MIRMITDLQYGSTGKGLIAGYLAEAYPPDLVVNCNMPNAGHTFIDSKGQTMIFKVLPNGIVSRNLRHVCIGPGSVFDPDRLRDEIKVARSFGYLSEEVKIWIHPNAVVLQPKHKEAEQSMLNGIASTMQGSMVASVEKMLRDPADSCIARDIHLTPIPGVEVATYDSWADVMDNAGIIQAEGSQGYSLGINGRFYPYCTSRACDPYRLLSDMGVPRWKTLEVIGTLRTFPIRVGNTPGGFSGSHYYDQEELSWEDIGVEPELTTVTQRVRRVFSFSYQQLEDALRECRPDALFLNFCNYMEPEALNKLANKIEAIADEYDCSIKYFGYGPRAQDVRHIRPR